MLVDINYLTPSENRLQPELIHHYGKNIHLINDPLLFTVLARFCDPNTKQPLLNHLLHPLYFGLLKYAVSREFPQRNTTLETRMSAFHPEGKFEANIVDPTTKAVTVNLARAGTQPSQICFDLLHLFLEPDGIRQDHISINRKIDDNEKVIGTNLGGVKIGGTVENAIVLFPDPMGATGSTIKSALEIYKKEVPGKARKYISLHIVVTPEFLRTVTESYPELQVYALRLDRGLSSKSVLNTVPGTHWDQEKGLNQKQYIVPGAGGVGEILNNSNV